MKGLIVAGEASGDIYGAGLSSVLRQRITTLQFAGMGGPRMAQAGVEVLRQYGDVTVVGVFEVFSKLRHLTKAFKELKQWILQNQPALAILIDFPDFNFRLAKFLKKQDIPVFYFISPQVWAWRKKRIYFLRKYIDLMITILPFEMEIYQSAGVPVVYVGHPLVEIVKQEVSRLPAYPRGKKPLIGIMPGSRDVEVRRHLPALVETISLIRQKMDLDALLIRAPSLALESFHLPADINVVKENRYSAMQACDLLLVASGTSTLEAAILGVPLFIVYRVSSLSWQLGKILVRIPYYGLVNWIAREKCIPEYIQHRMDSRLLAADAVALLQDGFRTEEMRRNLSKIVEKLGPPGAMERAADAILERLWKDKK